MSDYRDHSVPMSAAGYIYQLERALYHLSVSPKGARVGVEAGEDVVVKREDGTGTAEQDKLSGKGSGHPLQDRSVNLWNALNIWLKAATSGEPWWEKAELHFVTNRTVPPQSLVARLGREDLSDNEVRELVKNLRDLAKNPADSVAPHMRAVVAYENEAIGSVIRRIRLYDGRFATAGESLREKIRDRLLVPDDVDADGVVNELWGWITRMLMDLWLEGSEGWVSRDALVRQRDAIIQGRQRNRQRERAERLVPAPPCKVSEARQRPFVERMLEVDLEDEDIDIAIESYVRFMSERLRIERDGEVTRDEFDGFFDQLKERWRPIVRRNLRSPRGVDPVATGQRIFEETTEVLDFQVILGDEPVRYPYFKRGGYHRLADDDEVWWLPTYQPGRNAGGE